jgi:diacylglycerol kinase (ATP)
MNAEKFSIRKRLKSFSYAIEGLVQFLRSEHNAWIHLAATFITAIAAWRLRVSSSEAIALTLVVGLVWVTEIINTCLERMADLISEEQHPGIKYIKDLAAGAVLVAAIIAVIVGSLIFIPKC